MTRVFIADDHAIVRQGLKQIVSETADIQLGGEAADGQETLRLVRSGTCDVLVLDINMPGISGLDILRVLKRERPDLAVLVLSIHAENQYAVRCLRAGAAGYLTKESAPEELVNAIRQVAAGGKYVSRVLAESLAFVLCFLLRAAAIILDLRMGPPGEFMRVGPINSEGDDAGHEK
jgi:two-component system invasion response regulator UvrY